MTVDEIRARNSAADWSQQQAQDIAYLLGENKRLRTALGQIADGSPYSVEEQSSRYYRDIARKALQPDNAIPTQLSRNSDAIAAEEE